MGKHLPATSTDHSCPRENEQYLVIFALDMNGTHRDARRHYFMDVEFVWRRDEMPRSGKIVVVTYSTQPLRWAYLPDGATRQGVENAFRRGFRWYKSVPFEVTIRNNGKIIDLWTFTVQPELQSVLEKETYHFQM